MLNTKNSPGVSDDDIWVMRSRSGTSLCVYWRVDGHTYHAHAHFRGQALEIARAHWSEKCRSSMAQIEAAINSQLPPPEHLDGDVWVTRSGYCGASVNWQKGWHSFHTTAHCRGQALEIARAHWSIKSPRAWEKIEEEINALLPPQLHKDGDCWIEDHGGCWRTCWQSGWAEHHQVVYSQTQAEHWLRSKQAPKQVAHAAR